MINHYLCQAMTLFTGIFTTAEVQNLNVHRRSKYVENEAKVASSIISTRELTRQRSKSKPTLFSAQDLVPLKVNKVTSGQNLYSIDYYRFPFCQPENGPELDKERISEYLAGDRIESSPYQIRMKEDMYCEKVCVSNLGRSEPQDGSSQTPNKVIRAVRYNYHNNWLLDGLPAASKWEDDMTVRTRYWQGFPIGFVAYDTRKAYIHNHINFEIMYHPADGEEDKYQVVRFAIQPFSINHEFEFDESTIRITNPLPSCSNDNGYDRQHTNYDMLQLPQVASGKVLFTYDVTWIENNDLKWSDRWDVYVTMDNAIPSVVHWFSIMGSGIVAMALIAYVAASVTKQLMQHHRYETVLLRNDDYDYEDDNNTSTTTTTTSTLAGMHTSSSNSHRDRTMDASISSNVMRTLYQDIMLPPVAAPKLLAICCGAGAQILCTILLATIYAWGGFLAPEHYRASAISSIICSFIVSGVFGGYTSARLIKVFVGRAIEDTNPVTTTQDIALGTALLFPGICFGTFFFINSIAFFGGSTLAVPIGTIIVILFLWIAISSPLVFIGSHFGMQHGLLFPGTMTVLPDGGTFVDRRPIPPQPKYLRPPATIAIAGLLPFLSIYFELYFAMAAMWADYYYYTFGFFLLAFATCLLLIALVSIILLILQYRKGNHLWWWRSFWNAGGIAIYVFLYSFRWYNKNLEVTTNGPVSSWILYHCYMTVLCLGFFLATGFFGVLCCFAFNAFMVQKMMGSPNTRDEYSSTAVATHFSPSLSLVNDDGDYPGEGFALMDGPIHHMSDSETDNG